jgi:hypothetical protein
VDWALVGFQSSCEEVRKSCVLREAAGRFFDFDAIDEAEKTEHRGSEAHRHVDFANVASDAALDSGVADEVLQAVELFGQFVNPDNIYDLAQNNEHGHALQKSGGVQRVRLNLKHAPHSGPEQGGHRLFKGQKGDSKQEHWCALLLRIEYRNLNAWRGINGPHQVSDQQHAQRR